MFNELVTALQALGTPAEGRATIPFYAGEMNNAEPNYGTVRLDAEGDALWANGEQQEQALQGSIDVFINEKDIQPIPAVQAILRAQGVSYKLYSIQHETARKLIHYEWVFELEGL